MGRSIRYIIAVAASSIAPVASPTPGLVVGKHAVDHGIANGFVTIAMVGAVALPAFIVRKLPVDYCTSRTRTVEGKPFLPPSYIGLGVP